jgi:hypothetical protein
MSVHPVIIWWWNSSSHTIQQNQTQILYKQLEWATTLQQQTVLVGLFCPILMGQKCVSYQGPKRGFAYQCAIYFLCTPASLWRFNNLPPPFSSLDLGHDSNFSSMVKYSQCYYSHLGHWPRFKCTCEQLWIFWTIDISGNMLNIKVLHDDFWNACDNIHGRKTTLLCLHKKCPSFYTSIKIATLHNAYLSDCRNTENIIC